MLISHPAPGPLRGTLRPPSDKSITHRAAILGMLAEGVTEVRHPLVAADTRATREACTALGAGFRDTADGWTITGTGGRLRAPAHALDLGNSGTGLRLLAGVLAAQPFASTLTGDASLRGRPMGRIVEPLRRMGAEIRCEGGGTAPLRFEPSGGLQGIDHDAAVASAQVKSCLLLAGLFADGTTRVNEPHPSRDHTERMLPAFGVTLAGPRAVTGGTRLRGCSLEVPADPSSAAFLAALAALVPGSVVTLEAVGLNPTRAGFFAVLARMGAAVTVRMREETGGEPTGRLEVRHAGPLRPFTLDGPDIPALVDEVPILMALAAAADGTSRIRGAAELRVKESDRLAVMSAGLAALGISVEEFEDGVDVTGGRVSGGAVDGAHDHRCAMAFAVLGQAARDPVRIGGDEMIGTSYPDFVAQLGQLGSRLEQG